MSWVDVHTHLNMLESSPELVLEAAQKNGISRLITIGTGADDHAKIIDYVTRYEPSVFGTLGYHPHDAKEYSSDGEAFMIKHLSHPRIVAVGEIGLDYYYNHSERETQKKVFIRQMELAEQFHLPVEIHTRDAEQDTMEIIKQFSGRVRGLLHCFTGTQWLADEALTNGYNISFSGVVTFKNSEGLRRIVERTPIERIHLETDAPFLTPVPFRGKKNEPALLIHTAEVVARLKNVSLAELADRTTKNALQLFTKMNEKKEEK